ncbi:alkaline phosphatase family protein [Cellulomonas endophytica]|uniref:alkaline phosphatase family protein n=1 Tax=Cellulomonas endophytica TaxID=2494735 RepID=UPI001013AED2|nr:nucleotide pyrophosphatase/phosphodiesterase family protein [Cellulomonas endophytica]
MPAPVPGTVPAPAAPAPAAPDPAVPAPSGNPAPGADGARAAAAAAEAEAVRAGFLHPGGERRLGRVLPALADALGAPVHPDGGAARAVLGLPTAERVCVVLVDGLGHLNLAERSGHAPFLRSLLAGSEPLVSTVPSTTATAMGTFGTGEGPGRTAMLGYTVRDPGTGRLGNLVSWTDLPGPHAWQTVPGVLAGLAAAGVTTTSVGPARFAGSGLTEAALRGAEFVAAEGLDARVDAVARVLRRPGLAYLYWGEVDKAGHHHGWGSAAWGAALEEVDAGLRALVRRLPAGTLVVVTADHGMVDVDRALRWDAAADPRLAEGVELVAGEPRFLHLHTTPAAPGRPDVAGAVAARWRDVLGEHAVVAERDAAVEAGWFGPVDAAVRPVVGDVVVAMAGRATVVDPATQSEASLELVGVHGSRTPAEMLVPLLVVQA